MKKTILSLGISLVMSGASFGQLFSSGNNVIGGANVGIGANTPLARLHVFQRSQIGMGGNTAIPDLILQHNWNNNLGSFDYSWAVNAGTSLIFSGSSVANGNVEGVMSLHKKGLNVGYTDNGFVNAGGDAELGTYKLGQYMGLGVVQNGNMSSGWALSANHGGALLNSDTDGNLEFWSASTAPLGLDVNDHRHMILTNTGLLAIGTDQMPPTVNNANGDIYRLFVKGGIMTEEIKVELCSGWCDYVFAPDYDLLSLSEVEQTIKEKGHLHKIASAAEIERDGLELKSMTINQQEKIEELFLHLIEMDKRLKELEKENEVLKAQVEKGSK